MPDQKIFLLKIMEGTRCVAEAPLIVHEKGEALRNFYEQLPTIVQLAAPTMIAMVQMACGDKEPTAESVGIGLQGNHNGLVIGGQLPTNGHTPKGPPSGF